MKRKHLGQRYFDFALFLVSLLIYSSSVLFRMSLFVACLFYLAYSLLGHILIVSLLVLLVYLGALLILFAYLWMYITYSARLSSFYLFLIFSIFMLDSSPTFRATGSLFELSLGTSFLIFLVCLLFLAMIVVCLLLDFSLGGFSS